MIAPEEIKGLEQINTSLIAIIDSLATMQKTLQDIQKGTEKIYKEQSLTYHSGEDNDEGKVCLASRYNPRDEFSFGSKRNYKQRIWPRIREAIWRWT